MRGTLSHKLFPSIIRDLAHENATGRLRLTQNGKIREILIESGVPVFASSTIPEEQPESKLVQEGLITPEQLEAAILTSRQTSQSVEKILVQTKAITRLGLQRILCELSTAIVNSASEWVVGDYRFVAAPKIPLEAKLIWTSTECILSGARHASSNNSVLEALAPDDRTVKPASDPANSAASLSSTEGYVLSCIQSPTSIAETSMLTGLSHMETRRAILVLILLGLLESDVSTTNGSNPAKGTRTEDRPSRLIPEVQQARHSGPITEIQEARPSRPIREVQEEPRSRPIPEAQRAEGPEAQAAQAKQSVASSEPIANTTLGTAEPAASDTVLLAQNQLHAASDDCKPEADWASDPWPLEFESNSPAGFGEDSSQTEFNTGDISFVDFPEQTRSQPGPLFNDRDPGASAQPDAANKERAASTPVAAQSTAPVRERVGSIFIPPAAAPKPQDSAGAPSRPSAPIRENTGSIFIPGAAPLRANTGSVHIPSNDAATPQEPPCRSAPFAAPPTAPMREYPVSPNDSGMLRQQQAPRPVVYEPPPADSEPGYGWNGESEAPRPVVSEPPPADSEPGYGWNGESDPRLHQEWRDQIASARPDNGDDERLLKRVIEELGAKVRLAVSADYYQILGVDKLASNGSITKAYERITRVNDNHKSRWPYNAELQGQISSLMVVVNKAFETLGNPEKRRLYDMPPKQQAPEVEIERGNGVPSRSPAPSVKLPPASRPLPVPPISMPLPPPPGSGGLPGPAVEHHNPYAAAAELYKRGRSCFARSDLQAAAHLLRQAVTLDPDRSSYHYQLGMTLFILSQARAEHKHDKGCHVTCKMGGNLTRNQRIRHEAEQHLLKASELEPSNSDIKLKLALLYRDANMDRKAHQYFYEALMLDPNCHIARVELGMEDTRNKDEDQWIKDLMKDRLKKK